MGIWCFNFLGHMATPDEKCELLHVVRGMQYIDLGLSAADEIPPFQIVGKDFDGK